MNKTITTMLALVFACCQHVLGNDITRVSQVTNAVEITTATDYHITSDTPFAEGASVNIINIDQATVILDKLRPSQALKQLKHISIDGEVAQNGKNCQVKIYNRGAIIMPYASDFKPLTMYSGKDQQGESCNDYHIGSDNGYMLTLTDEQLNNRVQSFKLKRGYMLTLATRKRGYGYSRVFIADKADIQINLPEVLANKVSSYRLFKWQDCSKAGIAGSGDKTFQSRINCQSVYDWDAGSDMGIDCEMVAHHATEKINIAACGKQEFSPMMKTNNEPLNGADPEPASVDDILANWEELMATGKRLCTPSSWDGSPNFMKEFLDSIDARGWRCEIVDAHCYWTNMDDLQNWWNRYKRPIWISEWVWGASWSNNGIFATDRLGTAENYKKNLEGVVPFLEQFNKWGFIERYFYWNWEWSASKLYDTGNSSLASKNYLTPLGEYYATMETGVGYNETYNTYIPELPRSKDAPGKLHVDYADGTATITWREYDGEYNRSMTIERRTSASEQWQTLATIPLEEEEADYTWVDTNTQDGYAYRVHVVDIKGKDIYSAPAQALPTNLNAGTAVTCNGELRYIGGNLLHNGEFNLGTIGFTNGQGKSLTETAFMIVPNGGIDNSAYLQALGHGGVSSAASLRTVVDLEPNTDYFFSTSLRYGFDTDYLRVSLTNDGQKEDVVVAKLTASPEWGTQGYAFNSDSYTKVLLAMRWLDSQAAFDNVRLCRLFASRTEAIADAVNTARAKAKIISESNTSYPELNASFLSLIETVEGDDEQALAKIMSLTDAFDNAIAAKDSIGMCRSDLDRLVACGWSGSMELSNALNELDRATTSQQAIDATEQINNVYNELMIPAEPAKKISNPKFASATGWTTKAGSYQGGDQRLATKEGITCWNAWWATAKIGDGTNQTMAVKQTLADLPHGFYTLSCDATTEHYCVTDQHAYLSTSEDVAYSPSLTYGTLDIPNAPSWERLTTQMIYLADGDTLEIGFESSKSGAKNGSFKTYGQNNSNGDNREGWWCATNFDLKFVPAMRKTFGQSEWSTIALRYDFEVPEDVELYQVAGITPDSLHVCLERVYAGERGKAYVVRCQKEEAWFRETGKERIYAVSNNGLTGVVTPSTKRRVPQGSYLLVDGCFEPVERPYPLVTPFEAYLRDVDKLSAIDNWDGQTLPILGLGGATAIADTRADDHAEPEYYSIDGAKVNSPKRGLHIIREGNRVRKVLVK